MAPEHIEAIENMNTRNHREQVIAVLKGEKPQVIPLLGECPMDVTVFRNMFPAPSGDPVRDAIGKSLVIYPNAEGGTFIRLLLKNK